MLLFYNVRKQNRLNVDAECRMQKEIKLPNRDLNTLKAVPFNFDIEGNKFHKHKDQSEKKYQQLDQMINGSKCFFFLPCINVKTHNYNLLFTTQYCVCLQTNIFFFVCLINDDWSVDQIERARVEKKFANWLTTTRHCSLRVWHKKL